MKGEQRCPTIFLAGATGSGKSSCGNTLLGYKPLDSDVPFKVGAGDEAVTESTMSEEGFLIGNEGRRIRVIDSQGYGDGQGRDDSFWNEKIRTLREIREIHAFVWVMNAESTRMAQQDFEFIRTAKEVFGPGFLKNLVINFSHFSHSDSAEKKRNLQGKSFESMKNGREKQLTKGKSEEDSNLRPNFPFLAIDALYDPSNQLESDKFGGEINRLWDILQTLKEVPLTDLKFVKSERQRIEDELRRVTSLFQKEELQRNADRLKAIEERQSTLPPWGWAVIGGTIGGGVAAALYSGCATGLLSRIGSPGVEAVAATTNTVGADALASGATAAGDALASGATATGVALASGAEAASSMISDEILQGLVIIGGAVLLALIASLKNE